jgi:DNA polymerase-3 subunit gamma/tau
LLDVLEALADRDASSALSLIDQASTEGVQPTDLLAGVLEFLRDAMVLSVDAGAVFMAVTPRQKPRLQAIVDRWSIDSILAALQILAEARARMRGVSHGRLLAELALVRVARLENLSELSHLVERVSMLESGPTPLQRTPAQSEKKKQDRTDLIAVPELSVPQADQSLVHAPAESDYPDTIPKPPQSQVGPAAKVDGEGETGVASHEARPAQATESPAARPERPLVDLDAVRQLWPDLVKKVGATLGMRLVAVEAIGVEEPDVLVIAAKPGYNSLADPCGTDEAREKVEHCLQRLLRRHVTIRYQQSAAAAPSSSRPSSAERRRPEILAGDPMVQKVVELFEARPMHLEYDDDPESS